jgi:hypothetical protein
MGWAPRTSIHLVAVELEKLAAVYRASMPVVNPKGRNSVSLDEITPGARQVTHIRANSAVTEVNRRLFGGDGSPNRSVGKPSSVLDKLPPLGKDRVEHGLVE